MIAAARRMAVAVVLAALLFDGARAGAAGGGREAERETPAFAQGLAAYDAGDYASALRIWTALAGRGDAVAETAIAGMYLGGNGVDRDFALAARWYRRAAGRGNPVAQLNLGDMFARGLGVARDDRRAYMWLSLAAGQGRDWAGARRAEIARRMTAAEIAEAREMTRRWRPAASAKN